MYKTRKAVENYIHMGSALLSIFLIFNLNVAYSDILPLDDALRATYTACVGIDDNLSDLKKMAGINTAVTAVGTAAGVGAVTVGVIKANKDEQITNLEEQLEELRKIQEKKSFDAPDKAELLGALDAYYEENKDESKQIEDDIDELTKQSKKLGNWRTGLMAGNTATNVAGAIIASKNKVDDDLQAQIDGCKLSVKNLRESINQARFSGEDVSEATQIFDACKEYDYVDISPINKRGKGAMVSSAIGATTGLFGTVTSAVANSDKTRDDNTDSGKEKEKNLNTASNVLAGTSTVASGVATVFNATQISAIKKVANVAEKCTGVLK